MIYRIFAGKIRSQVILLAQPAYTVLFSIIPPHIINYVLPALARQGHMPPVLQTNVQHTLAGEMYRVRA